jgi:hypothetical protein
MPDTDHNNLTGAIAVHPAWYIQSTDPGAVGAHKGWVDTSTGAGTAVSPYPLKKRNAANSGWEVLGGFAGGALSSLTNDVTITTPVGGQSLVYDSTAAKWKNARPPGAALYAARSCI